MAHTVYAWQTPPDDVVLAAFLAHHTQAKTLIMGLPENRVLPSVTSHSPLRDNWQRALPCIQFQAANWIADFAPQTDLLLLPFDLMRQLSDFTKQNIIWQTEAVPQNPPNPAKIWQMPPESHFSGNLNVLIIGAGIAGAATAYELARRGAQIQILEAGDDVAQAASGNRQGLLYAKISPHPTAQTELLLAAYGHTHRLLHRLLPEQQTWQACGVLHLNHNTTETQRNCALAQHKHHHHLYHGVHADEASTLAQWPLTQGGLFWPQGAWLNPASFIHALLAQPNIRLFTQAKLQHAHHENGQWQVQTEDGRHFSGSHIVFCTGADSPHTPIIGDLPMQMIRGQTSTAIATPNSQNLRIALSGSSYLTPAWQNAHTFGATFINNDKACDWRAADQQHNWQELAQLQPELATDLVQHTNPNQATGHAAIRCDSHDHLPIVGALGHITAMKKAYAKLALDKNYRVHTPCPYLPQAYINTAHGSRGLATAPLCAAQIAAEICGTPYVLSQSLRHALQPNRLIIRQIVRQKTV